jgi:endonuclease YncB( thermonuclease family)
MRQASAIPIMLSTVLLAVTLGAPSIEAATMQGRVLNVVSGEQILITAADGRNRQIKLLGIEIPTQSIKLFFDAKRHLSMLVAGRTVIVEYRTVMANGVILGTVRHGGADVALRLLKTGLARVADETRLSPSTRRDYLASETFAKSRGLGLWRKSP